jgi:misacylated tRNA(Ala) deacylase
MMTEILYFPDDEYVDEFDATVTQSDSDNGYVVLDRTAFYKEGGGQPADHGRLKWDSGETDVVDVQKDHGDIKHYVDGDVPDVDSTVRGELDWERRHKHMRMHTAQHLVSWIVLNEFGASTAGNQIHADESRIDFNPVSFDDDDVAFIEKRANELIEEDLDVSKTMMSRDEVEERVEDGRTDLSLIPDSVDPLRVVRIGDDDLCPCGGTHVSSLSELGGFSVLSTENKGADTERLRFELEN